MRDRTMIRENWNWFVSDEETKTDCFLRFLKPHTKAQYEKYLIAASTYSLRIMLVLIHLLHFTTLDTSETKLYLPIFYLFQKRNVISCLSMVATTQYFHHQYRSLPIKKWISDYHLSVILIYIIPFTSIMGTVNQYYTYQGQINTNKKLIDNYHYENKGNNQEILQGLTSSNEYLKTLKLLTLVLHNLPLFLIGTLIITDWWEYGIISFMANGIYGLIPIFVSQTKSDIRIQKRDFLLNNFWIMCVYIIVFACSEKIKKESFITNHTNSKTKKQLMKFFSFSTPTLIMEKGGQIQMCNESFESFIQEGMKIKSMPSNFLKFIQADTKAHQKLTDIIDVYTKQIVTDDEEIVQEYELVIDKIVVKENIEPSEPVKKSSAELKKQQADDLKRIANQQRGEDDEVKSDDTSDLPRETFYDRYMAFKITVTMVIFKSNKSIMINFDSINDVKAKKRLMALHSRLIGKFVFNNQKRMELLHKNLVESGSDEIAELVGEFLGNSQVTLNMIQQMNYHFNSVSNLDNNRVENYVLSDEIDFCIEGLTASKWEKEIEIYLTKGEMPRKVLGDLVRFRICIRTMLDFGMKFSIDNQMSVKSEFKQYTQDRNFVIQFSVILTKDEDTNLDLLDFILNQQMMDDAKLADISFERAIGEQYQDFYQHIKKFGYGMIVFPKVVRELNGHYFLIKNAQLDDSEETNQDENSVSTGKFQIGFKLPFEQASMDSLVSAQNYKINFAKKEIIDGKVQVYKTPQIKSKTRRLNPIANDRMRQIMLNQGLSSISSKTMTVENQIKGHQSAGLAGLETNLVDLSYNSRQQASTMFGGLGYQSAGQRADQPIPVRDLVQEKQNYITQNDHLIKNILDTNKSNQEMESKEAKKQVKENVPEIILSKQQQIDESKEDKFRQEKNDTLIENPEKLSIPPSIAQMSGFVPKLSSQNSINTRKKSTANMKNLLLNQIHCEGKPKQFFGNQPAKKSEELKSISTSNFKAKYSNDQSQEQEGSSQFIANIGSSNENGLGSFDRKERSGVQTGNGSSGAQIISNDFKNQQPHFSFMEGPLTVKGIESGRKQQNYNDIRQSNHEVNGKDSKHGVQIPQSADMSSIIPDLILERPGPPSNDDQDSEKGDIVRSLNEPYINKQKQILSESTSDGPFNFHMSRIDSFMQASSDYSQMLKRDPKDVVKEVYSELNPKSMLLSQRVYRECCTPFREQTTFATKNLMQQGSVQSQRSMHSSRNNDSESPHLVIEKDIIQKVIGEKTEIKDEKITINDDDLFMHLNPYIEIQKNPIDRFLQNYSQVENQIMTLGFIQYQNTDNILQDQCKDLDEINLQTERQNDVINKKRNLYQQSANPHKIVFWQVNTLFHPSELNREYDAQDKNNELKNTQVIMDEIESNRKMQELLCSQKLSPKEVSIQLNVTGSKQKHLNSPAPSSLNKKDDTSFQQQRQIVLIAEDNIFISKTMQMLLDEYNVDYEVCLDGCLATEKFEEYMKAGKMFDIILMDLYMPLKGGFQTSIDIRNLEKKYGIADKDKHFICACSSQADLENEKRCFESGMDDIVAKPLRADYLVRMLKEHDRRVQQLGNTHLTSSQQQASSINMISEHKGLHLSPPFVMGEKIDIVNRNAYSSAQNNNQK